jgi:hypothetical protein
MVQSLLSQFPGPLTLYPSRSKFLMLFAGSSAFVAVGVVTLLQDGSSAKAWFIVLFFALCAVVSAAYLLPGAASLTLDANGFRLKQFYFVRKSRWENVTNIHTGYTPPSRTKRVRYNDAQWNGWRIATLDYNLTFPDTYGMPADDLAALMTQWRDRVLGPTSTE